MRFLASFDMLTGSFRTPRWILLNSWSLRDTHSNNNSSYISDFKVWYLLRLGEIWRLTNDHFIKEDAEEVPVDTLAMAGFSDHFWCEVGHGAAEGLCTARRVKHTLLTKAKIGKTGVTIRVNYDIIRLEIPEDDIALVQRLDRQKYLTKIFSGSLLI